MSITPRQTAVATLAGLGVAATIGWSCVVRSWQDTTVADLVQEHAELATPLQVWITTTDLRVMTGELLFLDEQGLTIQTETELVELPLEDLRSIQIKTVDPVGTTIATIATVGAVAAAGFGLILLIAFLTKTSCPFVYLLLPNGQAVLLGETYSGAVYAALERDDLLELPFIEGEDEDEALRLRLASEAHEEHHTDKAVLWLVEHPAGQRAVATHDARALVVGPAQTPVAAVDLEGADQLELLQEADDQPWLTDMDAAAAAPLRPAEEGLVLRFDKVAQGAVALELVASNTPWQDVVAAQLWSGTGRRLGAIQDRYADDDPATRQRLVKWRRDAGVDLQVERRDGERWTTVAWVPPQGWAHTRHVVVPLETTGGALELRLTGGVGFWLIDQVALAPVLDADPTVTELVPDTATTWDGRDEAAALASADGQVQLLPRRDTWIDLAYALPPANEGVDRTAFLATRGWYRVLPRDEQAPHRRSIARIGRHPEQASAISLELWEAFQERFGHIAVHVGEPEPTTGQGG